MVGRWCVKHSIKNTRVPSVTFIAHKGLPPKYSHIRQTPWSVFQDGIMNAISSASRPHCKGFWRKKASGAEHARQPSDSSTPLAHHYAIQASAQKGDNQVWHLMSPCWTTHRTQWTPQGRTGWKVGTTSKHSFLANHFRYYLTLFSKFFSPFLHSTCSLSVNRRYLVLDGVYHPLRAAIPSNPTRREHIIIETYIYKRPWTGLSPSLMPRSCGLMPPKFQMLLR